MAPPVPRGNLVSPIGVDPAGNLYLLSLDASGALVVTGTLLANDAGTHTILAAVLAELLTHALPTGAATETTLAALLVELLQKLEPGDLNFSGTGDLQVEVTNTNLVETPHVLLDGSINSDTLAAAPQRGDLIFGNATPLWQRLSKGTVRQVLQGDGTNTLWGSIPALMLSEYNANGFQTAPGALILPTGGTLTIATGVVTVDNTASRYSLETEGGAATDDLTSITGGTAGQIIVLRDSNSAHDVTIKNAGTLYLAAADFVMSDIFQVIVLICTTAPSTWLEICRSNDT